MDSIEFLSAQFELLSSGVVSEKLLRASFTNRSAFLTSSSGRDSLILRCGDSKDGKIDISKRIRAEISLMRPEGNWSEKSIVISSPTESRDRVLPFFAELIQIVDKEIELSMVESIGREWVSIWSKVGSKNLTDKEAVGLYGELWILRQLIEMNDCSHVMSWLGPLNGIHDFSSTSIGDLEVKTCSNTTLFHIHGLDQLMAKQNPLSLVVLAIEPSDNGESLVDLIHSIKLLVSFDNSPELVRRITLAGFKEPATEFCRKPFSVMSINYLGLEPEDASIPNSARLQSICSAIVDGELVLDYTHLNMREINSLTELG